MSDRSQIVTRRFTGGLLLCAAGLPAPLSVNGVQRERVLSPAFIVSPNYGTRASTVLLVDNHGQVLFSERSFGERGKPLQTVTGRFTLEAAANAA